MTEKKTFSLKEISNEEKLFVFRYPEETHVDYIKRAIGLPGDILEIVDKQIYINYQKLDESYKIHKEIYQIIKSGPNKKRDNFGPVAIP